MTTADGYVGASTRIVDHGSDVDRWCLVIVGDGYQASELGRYRADVESFLDQLRATPPWGDLWCAVNVHRIDVVSTESGADEPATCGDGETGSGAAPRTYFDTTFCSIGPGGVPISRLLAGNSSVAMDLARARVPQVDQVLMLVNSSRYGGAGGQVATASTSSFRIAIHEIGHSAFGLADEYDGSGVGTTPGESLKPNVTRNLDRATNKWRDLIRASTPMPSGCGVTTGTTPVPCASCTPPPTPPAPGAVGTYEGGDYSNCGVYRPLPSCYMRDYGPFCPVCSRVMTRTLAPYLPAESVTPPALSIDFGGVPEGIGGVGVTTHRAVVFEVVSCRRLTFRITAGPTGGFTAPLGTIVPADPTTSIVAVNRVPVWIGYTSTSAGAAPANGSVTVRCDELSRSWTISLAARTVRRPRSAVVLVLDHSGSMAQDAGDGTTKVGKLREATSIFIGAMLPGDAIGVVRFDDTAERLMDLADVGPLSGTGGRATAIGHINGPALDPDGATSIGAGVLRGAATLTDGQAAASPPYDVLAMVVLSDGVENSPPLLNAVTGSITARTFAIGLGLPANISVMALTDLTQGRGYLVVTGELTANQRTRLTKYFLQVLAGVTNASIVVDPSGQLPFGAVHRVPFYLTEADYGVDAFVLTPHPELIDVALEAPDGTIIDAGLLAGEGTGERIVRAGMWLYRVALAAVPSSPDGTHEGRWHVLLRARRRPEGRYSSEYVSAKYANPLVPYDVVVHAYSSLELKAWLTQPGFTPGTRAELYARLTEYTRVLTSGVSVWADVTGPDGVTAGAAMALGESGEFTGSFLAAIPGVYTARIRADGTTTSGSRFTRETTLTAVVRVRPGDPPGDEHDPLCDLVHCLGRNPKLLGQLGEGADDVLKCLGETCRRRVSPADLERANSPARRT